MNQNVPIDQKPKVAIIGSGISGLASAYQLKNDAQITVFEAKSRFGGHARTLNAGVSGNQPVDTGFIVFNYVNYPHLTRMFQELDVAVEKSNMSFGVTIGEGKIEYALRSLNTLFAQKRNLLRPQSYQMIRDILRFGKVAPLLTDKELTIDEYLNQLGVGSWFINYYLLPICGAIWSTPTSQIRDFPATTLIRFFQNHGLLEAGKQHQWWTVSGGSICYVEKMRAHLEGVGVSLVKNAKVEQVKRDELGVELNFDGIKSQKFDAVIMACHSDEALRILAEPQDWERVALGNLLYQDNVAFLHADENQMPKNRDCWSAWVYQSNGAAEPALAVTYWMNRLQNIDENDPLFVTLNPIKDIDEKHIYNQTVFRHPIFDHKAIEAQKQIRIHQGKLKTWYAGAYLRHGFHEDGFASAVRASNGLRAEFKSKLVL